MRRKKSLVEARRLIRYLEQFLNCVGVYEDQTTKQFIVQTYKEFNNLEDAIKLRDFVELKLKEYR